MPISTLALLLLLRTAAAAKDVPLSAIILYDGDKGPAYVQVTDLLINGKAEVRNCTGEQRIDKSSYGKMPKVLLAGATALERTTEGLSLAKDGGTLCVVPANLRLEKNVYTTAELADKASLQGKTAANPNGDSNLPPFKLGTKVVFVAAPDSELAEFLFAQRVNTIVSWQDYISRYNSSTHVSAAREALATLLAKDGEEQLAAYRQSGSGPARSFANLAAAKARASQCLKLQPNYGPASKLQNEVLAEITALSAQAQGEFDAYQHALSDHTPGYAHLTAARNLASHISEIDPQLQAVQALQKRVGDEVQKFDTSVATADGLAKSQRADDAYLAVTPYLTFANEDVRIASVIQAAYSYHVGRARDAQAAGKWQEAVQESQRAIQITSSQEAGVLLKQSQAGLLSAQNRSAADKALADSDQLEKDKNYVDAYEVLANLDSGPRALVGQRILDLETPYIKAASQRALTLQQAHTPIKGKVDEQGASVLTITWIAPTLLVRTTRILSSGLNCSVKPSATTTCNRRAVTCKNHWDRGLASPGSIWTWRSNTSPIVKM